jgi:cellulose synthase (UDP-forming)
MQVLRIENPLTVSGLTLGQRLGYAATLLGWFDSWRTVGFLALPPLVLISGRIPIIADALTFAIAFGVTYGLQQAALYLLGRGAYRPVLSIVFDLVRMSPNFMATLTLFTSRKPRFRVTPKGRMATNRGRIEAPVMLRAAFGTCFVGATVYVLHLLDVFSINYASEWAAAGAFLWLVVNAALVWVAGRRVRSLRFAAERRSAVRFAVDIPGTVDGARALVQDVSVGGALLATSAPLVERETHLVSFLLPGGATSIWARIRSSRRAASGEYHYALEFEQGQYPAKGSLARAVFLGRYPVAGTVRQPWSDVLRREIGSLSRRFQLDSGPPSGASERPVGAAA